MILTREREDALARYLIADEGRAKKLVTLSPEEAVTVINADGSDFTVEELKEFAAKLQSEKSESGEEELDVNDLNNVAGGYIPYILAAAVGVYIGVQIVDHGW